MFKLQVNIPDKLLIEIDAMAEQKYLNRTSLVTLLLAEGIERYKANKSVVTMADEFARFNNLFNEEHNNSGDQ